MLRDDVHSLNLHNLLVLRDCARKDVAEACYRFGCEKAFVEEILQMSMEALGGLAQSESLLFSLKYKQDALQKTLNLPVQMRGLMLEGFGHATA